MQVKFERSNSVSLYDAFAETIKDTIRLFNGTPIHQLPLSENFIGAGVYVLYYIGKSEYYKHSYDANRLNYVQPIYVGKTVPCGWSQVPQQEASNELFSRLSEHYHSICQADNLNIEDFRCRYMIMEEEEADLIGTLEASLIRQYTPIWNSCIDGFGNHDPGSGRYDQAKSDWDILHPGRPWADKLRGEHHSLKDIEAKAKDYYKNENK